MGTEHLKSKDSSLHSQTPPADKISTNLLYHLASVNTWNMHNNLYLLEITIFNQQSQPVF